MDIVWITPSSESDGCEASAPEAGMTPARAGRSLTDRLNAEWTALVSCPAMADELAEAPLAGHRDLRQLLAACGGDRYADQGAADALLARVVAEGLAGRQLAVRVTLQRVLGALVTISFRRTRLTPARRRALFEDLCATAWVVIATYPLERRPRRIASNISRDAEYLTCVRPGRLHDASRRVPLLDEHVPVVGLQGSLRRHPVDELRDLVLGLHGRDGLADAELALLDALAAGDSTTSIALALGCTDRTVRNLRRRLVVRLRDLSVA